ncbi:ABC transporter ATP-binding protein [Thalassotalea mangrovi]|uniref:ABC transporter ATP-binding protein n=1 Tax=Thalassotalea mangrovi TaxID=2572245 RepID=UPI00145CD93A|nr:ABC transporter ATP-binding protein [Thalassotalea mangrovi]
MAGSPRQNAVKVENLSWHVAERCILADINLSIREGERVAIIGPNGAGKTSLIKCLAGLHKNFNGEIELAGEAISRLSTRQVARRVALVSQQQSTAFELLTNDMVRMGLLANKPLLAIDDSGDDHRIVEALDLVGLKHKRWHSFNTLSGGEQQRVLIARSIVQSAKILLMDEPTNHLDIFYQHQILSLANELNITVIFSIHNLELASQYADRLVLMQDGKIIAQGDASQVLTTERLQQVFKLPCQVESHPFNPGKRVTFVSGGTCG